MAVTLAVAAAAHGEVGPRALPPIELKLGSDLRSTANSSNCGGADCTTTNLTLDADLAIGGLASPVNGTVTRWQFLSGSSGDTVGLRILRPASGLAYTGAGSSATVTSAVGYNGAFPTSVPIRIGDQIGLNASNGAMVMSTDVAATQGFWTPPLANGETRTSATAADQEVLVQATVVPDDALTFGKVTRNKRKGTATLTVDLPNPGQLEYGGIKVNVARIAVEQLGPGPVKFLIKAAGRKRKRLNSEGSATVSPVFFFAPNWGRFTRTQSTTITLRKKLK